jgi:Holliday junction DNA helicase RuvA
MIAAISGKILAKSEDGLVVEAGGLGYEVLLPRVILEQLTGSDIGDEVHLLTSMYLSISGNKISTMLVGFTNQVEREFFDHFTSVSGIGAKAGARCLTMPFARVARAILNEDINTLQLLPGIGKKKAQNIVHELKDKVASAALLKDVEVEELSGDEKIRLDAAAILEQLGYNQIEISRMFEFAGDISEYKTAEELLSYIYRNYKGTDK